MSATKGGRCKDVVTPKISGRNTEPGLQTQPTKKSPTPKVNNLAARKEDLVHLSDRYGKNMQLLSSDNNIQDYELHLEELGSSGSEYTSDDSDDDTIGITGRTADIFGITEPLTDRNKRELERKLELERMQEFEADSDEDDYKALRQIAMLEKEADDIDIDSAEENDIMAEIRAEITEKVREEMKSELAVYQKAKENLNKAEEEPVDDLEGLDPKLKEAILKMRKLDKILAKKTKREKQVKRERLMLQKRLKDELLNLKRDPEKKPTTDEKKNTEKFLMLALPSSHNSGISIEHPEDPDADEPAVTPLFQTQIPDDGPTGAGAATESERGGGQSAPRSRQGGRTVSASQSGASSMSGHSSAMTTDSSGKPIKRKKKKKDYIKRNIQLASDAGNTIAMTDDEKKRLEDLLNDLDGLQDIAEDEPESPKSSVHQVAVLRGDGFTPTADERKKLHDIDYHLQQLMPPDDYQSIASASPRVSSSMGSMLFTRTNLSALSAIPEGETGEHILTENKEQRHKQERLRHIEEELDSLTNAVELEMESPSLSEHQLNKLLDECARTMSRATEETSSLVRPSNHSMGGASEGSVMAISDRSQGSVGRASSLSSLYENPPHLPDNVLQQLLADARRSMSSSSVANPATREKELVLESLSEDAFPSSRNSVFSDSRPTSRSSLNSRQKVVNDFGMKPQSPRRVVSVDEDKRPFLPEIDPLGRLSTQKPSQRLNNEATVSSRPSSRTLSTVYTVRNSFSAEQPNKRAEQTYDSDVSSDENTTAASPQPPVSGRRQQKEGRY